MSVEGPKAKGGAIITVVGPDVPQVSFAVEGSHIGRVMEVLCEVGFVVEVEEEEGMKVVKGFGG